MNVLCVRAVHPYRHFTKISLAREAEMPVMPV